MRAAVASTGVMVNPVDTEGTSLDDILSDNEPEAAPVAEPQEPEAQAEGQPRGPDGKFVAKELETGVEQPAPEPVAAPPAAELPKEEYTALRAVRDENKGLKQQLEALQQQFQQLQQPKTPQAPPPSIWENEQEWQQHFGGQIVSQAVQAATYQSKLATSEIMARQAHGDFNDVWQPMNTFLTEHPEVAQKAAADPHPWGYAYRAFKNAATMAEMGATDLDALKAKMREELMAELQQGQTPVPQAQVPPSLTGERNVGNRSGPAWAGPKSLDQLLG